MTDEEQTEIIGILTNLSQTGFLPYGFTEQKAKILKAYMAEHERMRQFIRNLADESRVYLESEE